MNENGQKLPSEFEADRNRLRACWELASVFNFLKVFVPIIGSELKMSAEEIETSLILPDRCLRLIHIVLLKGIPPVSKNLKDPDAWVVTLSKKLFMWWPWVAEGDFPLTAAKGSEMETYKNLDPTVRLVILRALCEIRADQHDVIAYINDAVKIKNEMSTFRKKNIGEDGKGTSYWLDGNETIGLRLYKEVNSLKENVTPPSMSCQWETLATNLEEFQKVVAEYSSSASKLEVAVSAVVKTEAIPVLNKIFKKKQRELEKKMNEERILNNFSRSGITRSCRNRKSITYTFDEYDKAISEAIRDNKRMKAKDEEKSDKKETLVKEDPQQAGEGESTKSDENDVCEDSGEELDKNASEDSGEESDKNDVSEGSGEESEENDASKNVGEESDAKDVSEDSGEESDEDVSEEAVEDSYEDVSEDAVEDSDEDVSEDAVEESDEDDEDNKENMNFKSSKDRKQKSRSQLRIVRKETEEDDESAESDSNSKNTELETKDISENEDDKKENKNSSKENGVHSVQKMKHFGTKKRLVQRPNRNTAIESAVVSDSEDERDN
ncbi:hypothetical protein R6Q59_027541 [Mikania micrantha]|uniref:DDT domain-containing protein n=1 Tax=Mikania micrantha TaxID=192012 RepID=A0A5N6MD83_9ASTR|nr:hypothetical protein E3N88_33188 [Mikania micrantha]